MAEKEGFEPSIPFWGIHDFQSCALGQLRDFSMCSLRCQLGYNTTQEPICQPLFLLFSEKEFLTMDVVSSVYRIWPILKGGKL